MRRIRLGTLAVVLVTLAVPLSSSGQDAYRIGMSAAITGRAATGYAPTYEAYKTYFKRINDAGGINGRKVEIDYEDDRGEPQRAAAAAKKLAESSVLIVNASISATYKPLMTETVGEAEIGPQPLVDVCKTLLERPDVAAVRGVAFPVQPKQKPAREGRP